MPKLNYQNCPHCGIALAVRESSIGSVIRCKGCNEKIVPTKPTLTLNQMVGCGVLILILAVIGSFSGGRGGSGRSTEPTTARSPDRPDAAAKGPDHGSLPKSDPLDRQSKDATNDNSPPRKNPNPNGDKAETDRPPPIQPSPEDNLAAALRDLKTSKPETRAAAALALGKLGPTARVAVVDLLPLLSDPSLTVRREAFDALMRVGAEPGEIVPALIAALQTKDANVRSHAAALTARLGPDASDAVPALVAILGDKAARPEAVKALVKIGNPSLPSLFKVIEANDPTLCAGAVEAIGHFGADAAEAVPTLAGLLGDREYRSEAAQALGRIGKAAVPELIKATARPDNDTSRWAVVALGYVGPDARDAISTLARLERQDPSMAVQNAAGITLDRIRPPR